MRKVVIIVLMLILLVACSEPETNYQATIVSQQGTMIAMMQTTTPTKTLVMNLRNTATPNAEDLTFDAVSTLVAVESDEADQNTNPSTSNQFNQDIFQSMGSLVALQSTAMADTRKRAKTQTKIMYQDAIMQATIIKQNRIIITAIAQLTTQQTNLQSTTISQNSKITTQIDDVVEQNTRLINYNATSVSLAYVTINQAESHHATAVSLSRTAIVLARSQNQYLEDIDKELSDQTQLLRQICRNTAQNNIQLYTLIAS